MLFTCPRCGYNTEYTSHFKKHANLKKICESKISEATFEDIKNELMKYKKDNEFECVLCNKKYASQDSLTTHQKTQHKVITTKKLINDKDTNIKTKTINTNMNDKGTNTNIKINNMNDKSTNINNSIINDNIGYVYIIMLREHIRTEESIYKIGNTRDFTKRMKDYPPGSATLFVSQVADRIKCEKDIIMRLQQNYNRRFDIGNEYFEGDFESIIRDVNECVYNIGKPATLKPWRTLIIPSKKC